MYRFLEEAFWRDEFIATHEQVEHLIHLMEDKEQPILETELAEFLVGDVLKNEQEFASARIYSPEQKYRIGERIVFIHEKGAKYAEVLQVTSAGGPHNELGDYDKVYVHFKGEVGWKSYVANCPGFPLRFSRPTAREADKAGSGFITPGQLFVQFRNLILEEMRRALSGDGRCIYHDANWYLVEGVVAVNLDLAEQFLRDSRRPMSSEAILEELFPSRKHERNPEVYLFSLNLALDTDKRQRFARSVKSGRSFWELRAAAPPERSRYTVTEAALREGYIEVSAGFKQMLEFYQLGPRLLFSVYGGYEIEGQMDDAGKRVYGTGIASWYLENGVAPADIVYIKAPEAGKEALQLYSEDHERSGKKPRSEMEHDTRRVFLRHRIYRLFVESGQFMHYGDLAERLSSALSEKISPASVAAVLSQGSHLFRRLGPSRGLWGLREWLTHPYDSRVDLTSLLLDIGELQLVYKILKESSCPMRVREIAELISGAYGISPRLLIEANFIDPQDSRLLRLSDGRWGLVEWNEEWRQRLVQIDKEVEKIEQLTRTLDEQRLILSRADYSIHLVRSQVGEKASTLSLLAEKQDELVEKAKQIKEGISALEASDLGLQLQEKQALVDVEKHSKVRRQQLFLALCGAATSSVFWAIGLLGVAASIGALSMIPLCVARGAHSRYGNLSSLVSTVQLKRKDLKRRLKALLGDIEQLEQNIQAGAQGLEIAREDLEQCRKALESLEASRKRTAELVGDIAKALSGYDLAGLLVERDQLLELMGDLSH